MARKGKMFDKEIHSHYLNETKVLRIYHPGKFSTLYPYTISFMFDGDDYYQMGRIATFSDRLHDNNELKNTVFVGIHYKDREDRRRKYHPDGEEHEAFTNFVVKEAVPMIDQLIPTPAAGKTRVLMGDSLAGSFSLLSAAKHPELFDKAIVHSPFVDETILDQIKRSEQGIKLSDLYHTIGTNEDKARLSDGTIEDQLTPNRELNQFLKDKKDNYVYYELENGEHTWKYWQKDMVRALKTTLEV